MDWQWLVSPCPLVSSFGLFSQEAAAAAESVIMAVFVVVAGCCRPLLSRSRRRPALPACAPAGCQRITGKVVVVVVLRNKNPPTPYLWQARTTGKVWLQSAENVIMAVFAGFGPKLSRSKKQPPPPQISPQGESATCSLKSDSSS